MTCGSGSGQASIAVAIDTYSQTITGDVTQTLCSRGDTSGGNAHLVPAVQQAMAVRRLTPRECERLQGFPDDYTQIPLRGKPADKCPDGPRYKALGNSWAVPVVRWIGNRIKESLPW
jgi:DNA (cytosine-5)-methyltransferase 1